MMENNYEYSKNLFHFCQRYKIPFIYASSAAVYGADKHFKEELAFEAPLMSMAIRNFSSINIYAGTKPI